MAHGTSIVIVGYGCRLPGARNAESFWRLLSAGKSAITEIGPDRFPAARYFHPVAGQPGKSYSFAAGTIDDVWGFDAAAFGISPREAAQLDPQQRHLLEVTFDALHHAGIPPSSLSGGRTGVFVGTSSLDYAARFLTDPSAADMHMMTGNTLSLVANRLSYVLGLHGPSIAVDTACSSSLVALCMALDAIRAGDIDTAIVGGVNILLSPFPFVGFAKASMLSRSGVCRPFDASADGYVRSEGAVALVLRSAQTAAKANNRVHAEIAGWGNGQDGRTTGISMPSIEAQQSLLQSVYDKFDLDPQDLAFVEAHGPGTPVGDPIEADALGRALGDRRRRPLIIGSVKSNIGHLEPASGLAGALKAILSLENGEYPASLHFETPNPAISFERLNLEVANSAVKLDRREECLAGVNSFGFGGSIAHVVLRRPLPARRSGVLTAGDLPPLMLSAHSRPALVELAQRYGKAWPKNDVDARSLIDAAAYSRDHLAQRAVITGTDGSSIRKKLAQFSSDGSGAIVGEALGTNLPTCFMFSGNGSQWAGMGRSAWKADRTFRAAFEEVDARISRLTDARPIGALFSPDLRERLRFATVSQPLLFAIQYAMVQALGELGLKPAATVGHSIGEIAAAWAAGSLVLDDAIRIVDARSRHQERVRGSGSMAAMMLSVEEVRRALDEIGLSGVEIAAINSPRSVTLSGSDGQLAQFLELAKERRWSAMHLDLDYPFHSGLVEAVRDPLLHDLKGIQPRLATIDLFSTVTGAHVCGSELDGSHWWRNVRQPVQFLAATSSAIKAGYRVFVEIGPRPVLLGSLRDIARQHGVSTVGLDSLKDQQSEAEGSPVETTVARAFVAGAHVDFERIFGPVRGPSILLPEYPWQHRTFKVEPTLEASNAFCEPTSSLLGIRQSAESDTWVGGVDTAVLTWLKDHRVAGEVLFPAAGFAEMMLAAARAIFVGDEVEIRDLDIFQPLVLGDGMPVEMLTRVNRETGVAELSSRPRLSSVDWTLHAKAMLMRPVTPPAPKSRAASVDLNESHTQITGDVLYAMARRSGFAYGQAFCRVTESNVARRFVKMELAAASGAVSPQDFVLDPTAFDASFHGLLVSADEPLTTRMVRLLPVRIERLLVRRPGASIGSAEMRLVRQTERSVVVDVDLFDLAGAIVAEARGVRFAAAAMIHRDAGADLEYQMRIFEHDARTIPSRLTLEVPRSTRPAIDVRSEKAAFALLERASLRVSWDALAARRLDLSVEDGGDAAQGDLGILGSSMRQALESEGFKSSCDLQPLRAVTEALLRHHPAFGIEAAWLSMIAENLERTTSSDGAVASVAGVHRLPLGAIAFAGLRAAAFEVVAAALRKQPESRLVRLLVIGADHGEIVDDLIRDFANLEVVVVDLDDRLIREAEAAWGDRRSTRLSWQLLKSLGDGRVNLFDIALAVDSLNRIAPEPGALAAIRQALRSRAPLLAAEFQPSLFWNLMRGGGVGKAHGWWRRTVHPDFPISALMPAEDWCAELEDADFTDIQGLGSDALDAGVGMLIAARAGVDVRLEASTPRLRILGRQGAVATALAERAGRIVEPEESVLVWFADMEEPWEADAAVRHLTAQLGEMREALMEGARTASRVWAVVPWSRASGDAGPLEDPLACALQAASRVGRNEFPEQDVRCLLIDREMPSEEAVDAILGEIAASADDTEVVLESGNRRIFRISREVGRDGLDVDYPLADPASRLARPPGGTPAWREINRALPGPDEVEIEIEAAGLNFRDVMWSLGLLPDEAVEGGYAGATLGMECAGRISRVGPGISHLKRGDAVVALAPASLATHALVSRSAVLPLPPNVPVEAAAAMPVAFLTAWYALNHLAKLQPKETVLIHGAAGGVGLAALQLAQRCSANTIVTAGAPEKRALLKALGAHHVLNSRSLQFAEDIREITGGRGVDVVLNSLAGEAMVRSIGCLAPFGRFLELGKRDYYLNSLLALRGLRNNISYHAIDVDHLIDHDRDLANSILRNVLARQSSGELNPLPYRSFVGTRSDHAFRALQRSQHIGKIVVLPSLQKHSRKEKPRRFVANSNGTHIIVGGLGGFGFATARWLASCGARHILLLGRKIGLNAEQQRVVLDLAKQGVTVECAAVDVTDIVAVTECLRVVERQGSVRGIVHAPMALDDRLIVNADAAAIEHVLRPKVAGVANLHKATSGLALDYFLLYSSATTMVGNPGQFHYVAANAFLEGFARWRRAAGLPATVVSWGAIDDVGYLARNANGSKVLRQRLGSSFLRSDEALGYLDRLLGLDAAAAACFAYIDWRQAGRGLNIVSSAMFSWVASRRATAETTVEADLLKTLSSLSASDREDAIGDIVRAEIARALRLPVEEVLLLTPLSEMGMDSLMMLELRTALEREVGIEFPMMSLTNKLTPVDLVRRIASQLEKLSEGGEGIAGVVGALASSHIDVQELPADKYSRGIQEIVRRESAREKSL